MQELNDWSQNSTNCAYISENIVSAGIFYYATVKDYIVQVVFKYYGLDYNANS